MQFILTGFTQQSGYRVFGFERIDEDRVRTQCSVRADLALIRKYEIPIQELPLLCRSLLESTEPAERLTLTFTEEDMCRFARTRTEAREDAARKKKAPHRPASQNLGAAWRAQHP